MIDITNNFTLEEFAYANSKMKKNAKLFILIMMIISFLISITSIIIMIIQDNYDDLMILNISFFTVGIFTLLLLIFLRPKRLAKTMIKLHPSLKDGFIYNYHFDDEYFILEEILKDSESNNKMKYSIIKKAIINNNYIFLYINPFAAYIIKIDNISIEDINNLKEILKQKINKTNF